MSLGVGAKEQGKKNWADSCLQIKAHNPSSADMLDALIVTGKKLCSDLQPLGQGLQEEFWQPQSNDNNKEEEGERKEKGVEEKEPVAPEDKKERSAW